MLPQSRYCHFGPIVLSVGQIEAAYFAQWPFTVKQSELLEFKYQ